MPRIPASRPSRTARRTTIWTPSHARCSMALTNEQRSQLAAEAQKRGIDPAALIAAAEKQLGERPEPKSPATADAPTQDQPKLFMYLLPFVTVREVREK